MCILFTCNVNANKNRFLNMIFKVNFIFRFFVKSLCNFALKSIGTIATYFSTIKVIKSNNLIILIADYYISNFRTDLI